jgi:formyltetrahydrofolate-dependent phosphoribosylglycinamide formyltransferase
MFKKKVVFYLSKQKIAVFASGDGSNFQRIVEEGKTQNFAYQVELLVCDKPGANVINRAESLGIPAMIFDPKEYKDKKSFETIILHELRKYQIEFIVLAGYMRLIGPTLLNPYKNQIINIHPSLLPAFPGKDAVGQALLKGVKISGVTIHYVDEGMDTGPIITQEAVCVDDNDNRESLQMKIQQIEHQLYPLTIHKLCLKKEGLTYVY